MCCILEVGQQSYRVVHHGYCLRLQAAKVRPTDQRPPP